MNTLRQISAQLAVVLGCLVCLTVGKVWKGSHLDGHGRNWKFLTRFCYENQGTLDFQLVYPASLCCPNLLFYYDMASQWDSVYNSAQSCKDRVAVAEENNILLSPNVSQGPCQLVKSEDRTTDIVVCSGHLRFTTARDRWWFFVLSHCNKAEVSLEKYYLHLRNRPGFARDEFSADEFDILPTDIAFLTLYVLLTIETFFVGYVLSDKQMLHISYRMFLISVATRALGLLCHVIHYGNYSVDGIGVARLEGFGVACDVISDAFYLILLILLAKGWTIVRGVISERSSYRILGFSITYFILIMALFIWHKETDNEAEVVYLYDTAPGHGLVGLGFMAYVWFTYAICFTLKNFPKRRKFFITFYAVFSIWFLARPISILILSSAAEDYQRKKIVNGISVAIAFYGHTAFAFMSWPSKFNQFFPYQIRANQISAHVDNPADNEHPYAAPDGTATPTAPPAYDLVCPSTTPGLSSTSTALSDPAPARLFRVSTFDSINPSEPVGNDQTPAELPLSAQEIPGMVSVLSNPAAIESRSNEAATTV